MSRHTHAGLKLRTNLAAGVSVPPALSPACPRDPAPPPPMQPCLPALVGSWSPTACPRDSASLTASACLSRPRIPSLTQTACPRDPAPPPCIPTPPTRASVEPNLGTPGYGPPVLPSALRPCRAKPWHAWVGASPSSGESALPCVRPLFRRMPSLKCPGIRGGGPATPTRLDGADDVQPCIPLPFWRQQRHI